MSVLACAWLVSCGARSGLKNWEPIETNGGTRADGGTEASGAGGSVMNGQGGTSSGGKHGPAMGGTNHSGGASQTGGAISFGGTLSMGGVGGADETGGVAGGEAGGIGGVGGVGGGEAGAGGEGDSGPCDRGLTCVKVIAIAAGDTHTCAIAENGVMKCWGDNTSCQLGIGQTGNRGDEPSEMGDALPAVELGAGARPKALGLGMVASCVLREDGSIKCWGESPFGETGLGSTETRGCVASDMGDALPPVNLGTGFSARGLMSGYRHSCALASDGRLKCWGMNLGGQLGIATSQTRDSWGDAPDRVGDDLPFVELAPGDRAKGVGGGHAESCAILLDGTVKCWGYNVAGELGLGIKGNDAAFIGDYPNELGAALPVVPLGAGRTVASIYGGVERMCALLDSGQVLCWGEYVGDDPGEVSDALAPIPLGTGRTATSIAVGRYHTCAVLDDASLKCWGHGSSGKLGQGDVMDRIDPALLGDNLPPIDLGGVGVSSVAAGWSHTCALLVDGTVKCWGNNDHGQLGLGDTVTRGDEPGEMGSALPRVNLKF